MVDLKFVDLRREKSDDRKCSLRGLGAIIDSSLAAVPDQARTQCTRARPG